MTIHVAGIPPQDKFQYGALRYATTTSSNIVIKLCFKRITIIYRVEHKVSSTRNTHKKVLDDNKYFLPYLRIIPFRTGIHVCSRRILCASNGSRIFKSTYV
jgi:hypothetical protein